MRPGKIISYHFSLRIREIYLSFVPVRGGKTEIIMEQLSFSEIAAAVGAKCIGEGYISDVCTDNRLAKPGSLFVAIVGENNDGHKFAPAAVKAGAAAVLVNHRIENLNAAQFVVGDTKKALGNIAHYYLKKLGTKVLAVTGSVGKTTTRNMAYAAVSAAMPAVKTMKNYNNDIGLPLSVLNQLEKKHKAAVLEMGMNHFGEIEYLSKIAEPDAAIITNIGMSHIENLGSREGILKAKMEVCKGLKDNAVLFLNGDDDLLCHADTKFKKIYYAIDNKTADYTAENIVLKENSASFDICYEDKTVPVNLRVAGKHNVYNALSAFCAAKYFGAGDLQAASALESFEGSDMRMEILNKNGYTIINDCYNASPDSVKAAVSVLANRKEKRKIAVLGDMLEMGDFSAEAHFETGKFCKENNIDLVLCTGKYGKDIARGAAECGKWFENKDMIINFLKENDISDCCILIKASRGMHFEDITQKLMA